MPFSRSPSVRASSARASSLRIIGIAAASACVSQAFGRFTFSLLFTDVRDDLGISNTLAGALGSMNLAAYLTGTLIVSLVVGRVGLAGTTRIGVFGVTVGLILLAFASTTVHVTVALMLTGLFAAAVWVTVPGLAAEAVGPERRGTAIGIVGGGIGVGIVLASVLETTLGDSAAAWRSVYRVEAVLAVITTLLALMWLRGGGSRADSPSGLSALAKVPAWRRFLASYGLYGFGMALIITFLVAVLEEDAGYSSAAASLAFSAFGIGTVFGGPTFGPLSDRIGRANAMSVAYTIMAIASLVIAGGSRPWATLAAGCFGLAFTGIPTAVAARISDHVAAESFGAAYGVATLAFGAGLTIGPQLGGLIGDLTGSFRPVFWLATGVAIAAGALSRAGASSS